MPSVTIRALVTTDLPAAQALLCAALPYDRSDVVAAEKLLASNYRRDRFSVGAFSPGGELLGVLAQAGRWIKLLAVLPSAQRQGIGSALLVEAQQHISQTTGAVPKLRVGDHPGNYLAPGVDERYLAGHSFFRSRGFGEVARLLNLRAPVRENPLVTPERLAMLCKTATAAGYTIRRATATDVEPLLTMITGSFAPVWSFEVARALGPPLGGEAAEYADALPEGPAVHVALDEAGAVVAFAAHDGNNRGLGWFGPMGTLDKHRGHGLGEALLLGCLLDVVDRPDGGVIAWVGPVGFYSRASGAVPDRRFVVFEEL